MNRIEIFKEYSKFWLWVDLASTIPLEPLLLSLIESGSLKSKTHLGENFNLIRAFRLLKLLKLTRFPSFFNKVEERLDTKSSLFLVKLLKIFLYLLLVANGAACSMVFISSQQLAAESILSQIENSAEGFLDDPFEIYISSLYWAFVTMFSVGYGELSPQNTLERLVGIVVMNFSSIAFGYLLGNFGSIISQRTVRNKERRELVVMVNKLMKFYKIPKRIRIKSVNYVNYVYVKSKNKIDKKNILENLSRPLRDEIYAHINGAVLDAFQFFKEDCKFCKGRISRHLMHRVNSPNDFVFKEGDDSEGIFFITKGCVDVVDYNTRSSIKVLSTGMYFGEIGTILGRPRYSSIYTSSFLETLMYSKVDFDQLILQFPVISEKIQQIKLKASKNDLTGLYVECFLCKKNGHIAKFCNKMVEKESNQRKWLSSRKESQIIREGMPKVLKKHSREKKILKIVKVEPANVWGKRRRPEETFPGKYYLTSVLSVYNNSHSYQNSECYSHRPSIFFNELEISTLMQSLKNYQLVLTSEEDFESEENEEKPRESSFDTTLIMTVHQENNKL
jgi:hyperpolarization activated cyclic nucleotide-gated potassium channel 2